MSRRILQRRWAAMRTRNTARRPDYVRRVVLDLQPLLKHRCFGGKSQGQHTWRALGALFSSAIWAGGWTRSANVFQTKQMELPSESLPGPTPRTGPALAGLKTLLGDAGSI